MKTLIISFASILVLVGVFTSSNLAQASTQMNPKSQFVVSYDGKIYNLQPNQEVTITIPGVTSNDPRVATTIHFRNITPNQSMSVQPMYASGCSYSSEGYIYSTNIYGTTLISYALADDFCYSGGNIYSISRYVNSWYANSGLGWYYNSDKNYTTPLNHPDVTDSRTIHFTGPIWQQQNLEVFIDMHQDGSSGVRTGSYGGGL